MGAIDVFVDDEEAAHLLDHLGVAVDEDAQPVGIVALAQARHVVLAGDINETQTGKAWGLFGKGMDDPSGAELTFPAAAPVKRIDALFTSPTLHATRPAVDLAEADLVAATDHRPLWADLDLRELALPG